jgi:Rrf2 family iron-sulfur cluster assembly transcriptional regulator
MQLTNKARYAITAMLDLATSNTTKPVTLDVISNRQNISLSYLEQLFAKLRKASLVKSVRGPGGGYRLDTSAQDISLTQIIEAVDENYDLRRCEVDPRMDRRSVSQKLWCQFSYQLRGYLDKRTLQDVIDDSKTEGNLTI